MKIPISLVFLAGTTVLASLDHRESHNAARAAVNGSNLLDEAIQALGGREALEALESVTYESANLLRLRTLMQNYNLAETDRYLASSGSQNVSFSFEDGQLSQRIDRSWVPGELFLFTRPEIAPRDFSLVVRGGPEGFACLVEGNNIVILPADQTTGYLDSAMTEYLLSEAFKLSPKLLLEIEKHSPSYATVVFRNTTYPAIEDKQTNITVVLQPDSHLPFLIRTYEDHPIFGPTSKDLQLYNYKEVDGVQFPHSQKTIYGEDAIIDETDITKVTTNVNFEQDFFDGLDESEGTSPSPPMQIPTYSHALLGEFWACAIWPGLFTSTVDDIIIRQLADDLPGAHHVAFPNTSISQMVLEFEESVVVFEAPHHQTEVIIQWVKETLGKPISHLWVSHHHHDHNLEVAQYVELGASIIVPEMAASFWSQIPGINLVTITEEEPYIISDGKMQARFLWRPHNVHAADWTYAVVTTSCPTASSSMIAFTADIYSDGYEFDYQLTNGWLLQSIEDGLSKSSIVVPAHGNPYPMSLVYERLGSPYPDFDATSFKTGGPSCLSQ
jgi:hypothetical protein